MKVNSNIWQYVSSYDRGSAIISLEFPSELFGLHICSTNQESVQEQFFLFFFLTRGLQVTHELQGLNVKDQYVTRKPIP